MYIFHLLRKIYTVKKAEQLNAQQITTLQENRFKKLLRHTLEKSTFYRRYYQEQGISIDKVDQITLKDLPPINKELMMKNYDEFVCDSALKREDLEKFIDDPFNQGKKYKKRYQVIHTSGSTGTPGLFVYGPNDWDLLNALVITRIAKAVINPSKKIKSAFIGVIDGHHAGISLAQNVPSLFCKFMPISINSPIRKINQIINEYQPHILSGYSSGIYLLAQEQIDGHIDIKPKRIVCSADPLTATMEETIKKAFAVDPVNFYAASEGIGMAVQCDLHRRFHFFNDWYYIEIVDKNFNPVDPGGPGNVLLTNLYNYTQPLIRYEMSDEIILDDKPCQCGWSFPLIKDIVGRQEEFLWFERANGEKEYLHPTAIISFTVPGLEKLQVVQNQKNTFTMKVIIQGNRDTIIWAIQKKMKGILQEKGLEDTVNFDIEEVEEIPNDSRTKKYKFIIPLKNQ